MFPSVSNLQATKGIIFSASLTPNRSLSRFGFWVLFAVVSLSALAVGISFMQMGAWPVLGFCGLEILLLYLAFHINYISGKKSEEVKLTANLLEVRKISSLGHVLHWRFEPTWLQVTIDEPLKHDSKLKLASHGRSLEIGAFLTPKERLQLARALRNALDRWHER